MFTPSLFIDVQREVDLLADLLTIDHYQLSPTKGYQGDHLYVRGYIEDHEDQSEDAYYHKMLKPSITALAGLLSNANYMEFEKLPCCGPEDGLVQIVGGGEKYGFWLRKSTSYRMFGVLGEQCPEHVAKPEFDGYFGSDDKCPDDCNFVPQRKGLKPGTQTIYDIVVRSSPKLVVDK